MCVFNISISLRTGNFFSAGELLLGHVVSQHLLHAVVRLLAILVGSPAPAFKHRASSHNIYAISFRVPINSDANGFL
jgi:hypothetical protein